MTYFFFFLRNCLPTSSSVFFIFFSLCPVESGEWSGGAKVLGELPVPGRPAVWITVGQGPTALAVGAGGGCLDIFTLIYLFSPLWGWSGDGMVLGKLLVPGRPTNLDYSRARAYCACSRCGWGLFGHFFSVYHFSFLSPSLWETT